MSYLVQQWLTPHWHDMQSFKSLEAAEEFALEVAAAGKVRIIEFPGGNVVRII